MSIYINQRMIDYYNKYVKNNSHDNIDFKEAIHERLNRYSKNEEIKSSILLRLDYIDDAIVSSITNHNNLNHEVIKNYCAILWDIFCENPLVVYESKMFHKEIAPKVFTEEQLKKINSFKLKTSVEVMDELTDTFNKPNQTISSKVLKIAKGKISTDEVENGNLCDKLYNYLLNNYPENDNIYTKEYIVNYTAYLVSNELNTPMPYIYISNHNIEDDEIEKDIGGVSKGDSGIIILHYNLINDPKLLYEVAPLLKDYHIPPIAIFMETVIHEARHSKQANEVTKNQNTKTALDYIEALIFKKYLSEKDYNEYKENYQYSEIEMDAEEYSWEFLCNIIESRLDKKYDYLLSTRNLSKKMICKNLLAYKKEKDRNKLPSWQYNVKKMNELVLAHTELLTEYPQLKLIYNSDGVPMGMLELLRKENTPDGNNDKEELSKIYKEYYIDYLSNNILAQINLERISRNDQFLLFNKIIELIKDEYQNIIKTMLLYDKYDEGEKHKFDFVTADRIKRIKDLFLYLKANENIVEELKRINPTGATLEKNILAVKEKITKLEDEYYVSLFRGIEDSKVHDDLELLKEGKFYVGESTKRSK